jgi:hypothetical protein
VQPGVERANQRTVAAARDVLTKVLLYDIRHVVIEVLLIRAQIGRWQQR